MQRSKILVVDDDTAITKLLKRALSFEGYDVTVAHDGREGLACVLERLPELIILDLLLPVVDGMEVCRRLRADGSGVPILMLTAKDAIDDRVAGLETGADDYLVKPFALAELLARVKALLRRPQAVDSEVLRYADLKLDTSTRLAYRGNRQMDLTKTEYELLACFLRSPGRVLTRGVLLERVWGYDFEGESNVLEVYVRYLRVKLEAGGEKRLIQTIRGAGYALRE
jgi:two-component system response regulator MprA